MKSLFAKLFLGFWLTSLVVALGAHLITRHAYEQARGQERHAALREWRQQQATAAQAILVARGDAAMREWLAPFLRRGGPFGRLHLVTATGEALAGRPLPPPLLDAFAARSPEVVQFEHEDGTFVRLTAPGAPERWLVWAPPRHASRPHGGALLFGRNWRLPPELALTRLGLALLVSGAVCYGLARHFSQPVKALRAASAAVSGGDLNARVPASVTARGDELGRLAEDFNRMAEAIARMVESRSQLLRDVSHELRSPLARLQIALELARKRSHGAAAQELDRIEAEAARLDTLIAQVLTLARLENAAGTLARESFDLAALLDAVVRDAAFEAEAKNIRIAWTRPTECRVHGDPNLLRSACENVVRNAVLHSPVATQVAVALETMPTEHRIRVDDAGPGVPGAQLESIFEPFVRGDVARTPGNAGTGLGLAIARRAITKHGGTIEARNGARGGLEVVIRLPREVTGV